MKIKVEWKRETTGVSEIDVPEAEVAAWLNESYNRRSKDDPDRTPESITPQDCLDWLQSGDDDVWIDQIDHERDEKNVPWNDTELERLA
jgi:hypothetical protein